MSAAKILVVDDDKNILELVRMRLESANYEVATALKEEEAIDQVKKQIFDLSIIDLQLVHRDGISLMQDLHLVNPEMPVIILTAHGSIENAVEAMKKGAYSYLTKPFDPRDLLLQIQRALENRQLTSEIKRLKGLLDERYSFSNIIAKSEKMQRVLEVVSRIAKTDSTIYIHGESGTGKELIARLLHRASPRAGSTSPRRAGGGSGGCPRCRRRRLTKGHDAAAGIGLCGHERQGLEARSADEPAALLFRSAQDSQRT